MYFLSTDISNTEQVMFENQFAIDYLHNIYANVYYSCALDVQ